MSGIEVAGLVIGVVPIVVEILKSYSATKDRLKTLAHHAQVIYDVQLRFRVASANFSNDLNLLLRAVVDDVRELSGMVDDSKHVGWQDASLEERLHSFLGRDYQVCEEVVVKIRDVLRKTQARLTELDPDSGAGRNDSRIMAIKRLYNAFDISCKENEYRKQLEILDQWNVKLSHLRAQRCKLQKRRTLRVDCLVRKSVPKRYTDIHTASQKLHDSLKDSWSCTNISHVGHQAKLSLDAQAGYGTAQLDMVIACRKKSSTTASTEDHTVPLEPPIWLHVRSVTTNDSVPDTATKLPALLDSISTSLDGHLNPPKLVASCNSSVPLVQKVKKSLKRVHFDASTDDDTASNSQPQRITPPKTSGSTTAVTFAMLNLKATSSVCCHLSKACQSVPCKDISLGYLESIETPHSFRFVFYDAGSDTEAKTARKTPGNDSYSIGPELAHLQVLHQLTLAQKLATAVLQYHSTSWLPQNWGLNDVSYFTEKTPTNTNQAQASEAHIVETLQTLHLSTHFPSGPTADSVASRNDLEQMKYMYGIRNLTLAKLGVALLEIGLKKELSSTTPDSSVPASHHVISARKILLEEPLSLAMLGKRYLKIARKCIDCDFSCGEDLGEEALRSAVYTDVVCTLDEMIADWKKFIGIG
jgi:hypothetical protein